MVGWSRKGWSGMVAWGWLDGWLVGWLVIGDWRLTGWLVDWLTGERLAIGWLVIGDWRLMDGIYVLSSLVHKFSSIFLLQK